LKKLVILSLAGFLLTDVASAWHMTQANAWAQRVDQNPSTKAARATSAIKGRILDMETKTPLAGVTVTVSGTDHKAVSDASGGYALPEVLLGYYTLAFELEGFYAETKTDIIVRSGRTTVLNVELLKARTVNEKIQVVADYFPPTPTAPVSRTEFNPEELRRDAASGGDISRALYVVPGVVKPNEKATDLIVRGGSPAENGFYIDNIFIPNINHFPQMGTSGGNISMLNMDFIENVAVSTGGFGASYGNRLSSIFDITYREGNREKLNGQLNLSAIGYGAQLEGPLPRKQGAWMFSVNRSYFDLISDFMDMDDPFDYYDFQAKVTYDLGVRDELWFLGVGGRSWVSYAKEGRGLFTYATAGLNWRHLWGEKGYSDTSVSSSFLDGTQNEYSESEGSLHEQFDYANTWLTFRNVNHLRLSAVHQLEFGVEAQNVRFRNWDDYDNVETRLKGTSAGVFLTYLIQLFRNVSLSAGARLDYVPISERIHVSSRLSFSWLLTPRLTMTGAFGLYFQQMPLFLIEQDSGNAALPDPRARHLVLGLKYLFRQDIQLTLEAYDKLYTDHPMAPSWLYSFVIDDVSGNDRFRDFGPLVAEGRAYARGVEFTVQKKISNKLHGLFSLTYYRARYRDLKGFWRNRLFDNRFIVCLSGGYKPSRTWEFNVRWTLAGNNAFTPIDEELTAQLGYPVARNEDIMAGHLSDYQNFSFRIDKRFSFRGSNLIVFIGALNLFDHKNEFRRYWRTALKKYVSEYMWGLIPYIGFEFEF